jgi:hypothetical protein
MLCFRTWAASSVWKPEFQGSVPGKEVYVHDPDRSTIHTIQYAWRMLLKMCFRAYGKVRA